MARIRTIKPEILEDEKTSALTDAAFRLFISMISLADDHGNVRADVRWLSAQIWWAHGTKPNVLSALIELSCAGLIIAYGVRGGTYAAIVGWQKHQRIDNAGKGRVPALDDPDSQPVKVDEHGLRIDETEQAAEGNQRKKPYTRRVAADFRETRLDPDQEKEGEREGEAAAKPPRHARSVSRLLPADWRPHETDLRRAEQARLDVPRELEKFRAYHEAKGNKRADWDAAWRSWIARSQDFARRVDGEDTAVIGEL